MTLLYRAIWNDDRPEIQTEATGRFRDWIASKGFAVEVPYEGVVQVSDGKGGTVEVAVARAAVDGVEAVQTQLVEDRANGQRWSTTMRVIVDADEAQWLWVDLDQEADDFTARRTVAAPRLVADLVHSGIDPRVDHVRLSATPLVQAGRPIAGLVRHPDRTLPIIVFSHDPAHPPQVTMDRAEDTQRNLGAAVQVFVVLPDEEGPLRDSLGAEFAVWGGAARLYLPNRDERGMRANRHRYVLASRMDRHRGAAAQIFGGLLTASITARRPPEGFEKVRRELWGGGESDAELIRYADDEIERLRRERDELRAKVRTLDDEVLDARVDLLDSEEEVTRLQDQLIQVWRAISAASPRSAPVITEPDLPATVALAIERSTTLDGLVVHPDASCDIDDLDDHDNGPAWALKVWRGLSALAAYGCSKYDGNFRSWCTNSDDPRVWPATDKKLALRESETVQTNARLKRMRLLPVDPAVASDGKVYMWAHLKIAEGGGRLAPRIYFHDDTKGPTGLVHVGFIGPHHHMENTKTN